MYSTPAASAFLYSRRRSSSRPSLASPRRTVVQRIFTAGCNLPPFWSCCRYSVKRWTASCAPPYCVRASIKDWKSAPFFPPLASLITPSSTPRLRKLCILRPMSSYSSFASSRWLSGLPLGGFNVTFNAIRRSSKLRSSPSPSPSISGSVATRWRSSRKARNAWVGFMTLWYLFLY